MFSSVLCIFALLTITAQKVDSPVTSEDFLKLHPVTQPMINDYRARVKKSAPNCLLSECSLTPKAKKTLTPEGRKRKQEARNSYKRGKPTFDDYVKAQEEDDEIGSMVSDSTYCGSDDD